MYLVLSVLFKHKGQYAQSCLKKMNLESSAIKKIGFTGAEGKAEQRIKSLNSEEGRVELFIFNVAVVDAVKTILKDPFESLHPNGVHWGNLSAIDICPSRYLMLSLGLD